MAAAPPVSIPIRKVLILPLAGGVSSSLGCFLFCFQRVIHRIVVPDRSSPSRVRFAASRPGRLRADPKDALLTRGKGGVGPWGREGEIVHDKGYYHSSCGRTRRKEPFGHTGRLEPQPRGRLSA